VSQVVAYSGINMLAAKTVGLVRCKAGNAGVLAFKQVAQPRGALLVAHYRCSKNSLSTEDKLNIMELCHRFDRAINLGDEAKVGTLFHDNASVCTPKGTVVGREKLVEYFNSCKPLAKGNRHLTCDILVEPDGEQGAVATSYRILHKASSPPALVATGIIEDRLVQVDGEWKFASRKFIMDPPSS